MNLSKDDLSFALVCAKGYFYDSLNSDYPNKDDQKNAELFRDLEQAANNDTLEIEGYQRDKWIKLNRNNKKTFPPKGKFLGCFITGYTAICIREDEVPDEEFASGEICPGLAYWRPLPKPPVETEKGDA